MEVGRSLETELGEVRFTRDPSSMLAVAAQESLTKDWETPETGVDNKTKRTDKEDSSQ